MKAILAAVSALVVLGAGHAALAQQQPQPREQQAIGQAAKKISPRDGSLDPEISLGQLTPTPEMWFYDQALRMYRDPKVSVRRHAEFMADQRRYRLTAMRWFGFSNSRPSANSTALMSSSYSPSWTSNTLLPFQWSGATNQPVVIQPRFVPAPIGYGLW